MPLKTRKDRQESTRCDRERCCGCNPAEFLLVNGEERTLYCQPGFSGEICEMFRMNAPGIAFELRGVTNGIYEIACA